MNTQGHRTWLIWGMITAGLILAVSLESTVEGHTIPKVKNPPGGQFKDDVQETKIEINRSPRRNPFIPLTIQTPKPKPVKKRRVQSIRKAIYAQEASQWKLMGVVHGQFDQYAVIDFGDAKRIFVKSGTVLDRLGWVVRAIHEDRVVLTPLPQSLPEGAGARERILRFSPFPSA